MPAPSQISAATPDTLATSTNSPSFQGLALAIRISLRPRRSRLAVEEGRHARVGTLAQLSRRAARDDRVTLAVEHDAAPGDLEDARELVRDHDQGRAQPAAERQQQLVELDRGDGVEPRG